MKELLGFAFGILVGVMITVLIVATNKSKVNELPELVGIGELAPATDSRILKLRIDKLETELRRNKGSACRLDWQKKYEENGYYQLGFVGKYPYGSWQEIPETCLPYLDKVETKKVEGRE